jgi:hypothetical protein
MVHAGDVTAVDLLLHPVRLRIVQAFLGGRELTTAQLAAELADVPAGRLYRHIALLVSAGVLEVAAERRVRGAVERTYVLRLDRARVEPGDLAAMSREDHLQAFMTFVAGLLADYERYLASGEPDLPRDGVAYAMNVLWLNDREYAEFRRDLAALVTPRMALGPGRRRKRRLVASVFMPVRAATGREGGDDV